MAIFVTWQLILTLDSIRNSCDVCYMCLLWVVAKFSPLASMVVVGMNACGPSPIPPFHLKQDLQEEEKPKSWDLPRTWQLATHRICRNTFHLRLHLRFRFRLRLCLPLHSQDSLKTRVWIWHSWSWFLSVESAMWLVIGVMWSGSFTVHLLLLGGISVGWPLWTWNGWDGANKVFRFPSRKSEMSSCYDQQ